jgi:hypothetical protein
MSRKISTIRCIGPDTFSPVGDGTGPFQVRQPLHRSIWRFECHGGSGCAYYMGDLNDGVNMKHLGLGPSISLGALYRLTEHVSARGELRFYQVSGTRNIPKTIRITFHSRHSTRILTWVCRRICLPTTGRRRSILIFSEVWELPI